MKDTKHFLCFLFLFSSSLAFSQAPTITSFTPSSGPIGTSITITGTNFDTTPANNIVFFGATQATVSAATIVELTVTVPVGATYMPITVLVNELIAYSSAPFVVTFEGAALDANSFTTDADLVTGDNPISIGVADFDGDGKSDLAVANRNSNTVSIFRNTGLGVGTISYADKIDFVTGSNPESVSIGDLDGDGKADLALANFSDGTVSVFRNTSSGVGNIDFTDKADYATGTSPRSVAIGDLDGDGKSDLAVVNRSSATVSIFRNTSSSAGSISYASKMDYATGNFPNSVSVGDLDGDGQADLVVTNELDNTVSTLKNISPSVGTISYDSKVDLAVGSFPSSVSIGDLDGDSKPDLIVTIRGDNIVSTFRNTSPGDGTIIYTDKVDYVTGTDPNSVSIGDIDGDGKVDLAVANGTSNTISLFRNTSTVGTISYADKVDYITGTVPKAVSIADLDGDGKGELAYVNSFDDTISILRNTIAPPPTITSYAPTSGPIGTSVTITGTDFDTSPANNIVFFGATQATVSAATATELTVTVPSGATYMPITVLVNGLIAYSSTPFVVTFGGSGIDANSYDSKVDYTAGSTARSVAIGDLDGDGKADLVVANEASSSVSIFKNISSNGSIDANSFAGKVDYSTGSSPFSVSIGDLDGDGKADLAVASSGSDVVSVFRNMSTTGIIDATSFAAKVDFSTGSLPRSVTMGDLDGDGKIDLAATNLISNTVSVLRNTSTSGTINTSSFAPKVDYPTGLAPLSVSIGDLDGDGNADLAVANFNSNTISLLRNTSTSGTIDATSFASKVDYITESGAISVAMGDLDGDGKTDLAVANSSNNSVSIFRNTSTNGIIDANSFAAKVNFTTGLTPYIVSIGNLDGDGTPDLAVANSGSNTVSVFRNASVSGTIDVTSFASKVDYVTGSTPFSVSIGDLDGDGKSDLVTANAGGNTISVLRNIIAVSPTITSFSPTSGPIGTSVTITGTDFDPTPANNIVFFGATQAIVSAATSTELTVTVQAGASYMPITVLANGLTAYSSAPFISIFDGSGINVTSFPFGSRVDWTSPTMPVYNPISITMADLDGDGKADLVMTGQGSNTISVFRNNSMPGNIGGVFSSQVDLSTGTTPQVVSIGDLDGDGKVDLVVSNFNSHTVSVFKNTSTPGSLDVTSFAPKVDFITGTSPRPISIGDLDRDGKPDLAVGNWDSNTVSVLRNTSSTGTIDVSSFAPKVDFTTGSDPRSISIIDLDRDMRVDLVVVNNSSNSVSVIRNISTAGTIDATSFAHKIDFTTGSSPIAVSAGDLDGDSRPDLAVVNGSSSTVSVLRNTSIPGTIDAGSLDPKVDFTTGTLPFSVAIGDLDGDGKADLATANLNDNTVSVLKNTSTNGVIGTTSFAVKVDYFTGSEPMSVAIGDLDGDGKADLVTSNRGSSLAISVLRNTIFPLPTLTSFTPTSGLVGTVVTITGTNFDPTPANNIVFFGATQATVSAATATELMVNVPTGATYMPITVLVNGLIAYSAAPFVVTFDGGGINPNSFASKVDFTTGSNPQSVAIGDLDGDGKVDLVVANQNSNTVSVFRNISNSGTIDGTSFAPKVDYTTGITPLSISIGDLDGDGKPDLAVTNQTSNTVSVFRNTSTSGTIDGTSFAPKEDFTTGTNPFSVAIGDLDADGKADLAVANQNSNTVSVFRNTSTMGIIDATSFASKVDYTSGTFPRSVSIGDLDGNGKADLAVANLGSSTVSVFRNASTSGIIDASSFAPKVDYPTGDDPISVSIGDLDGDGKPDLAVANNIGNTVSVLRNTSAQGTIDATSFAIKMDYISGTGPQSVSIGDLDGDGKADLAVANSIGNTTSIFRNGSTSGIIDASSFAAKVDYTTGAGPVSVFIGDLDGDGKADLAVVNAGGNTVSVLRNLIVPPPPSITSFAPTSGQVGTSVTISGTDFDPTPANNIVFFGATQATVSAATATELMVTVPTGATYMPITVLVNELIAYSSAPFVVTFGGSGIDANSFEAKVDHTAGSLPWSVSIGDLDGDGKPDLAVTNNLGTSVSVFRNISTVGDLSATSFAAKMDFTTGSTPVSVSIGDLDGDGKPDLAVANRNSSSVSVFRNTSTSGTLDATSFAAKVDYTTGSQPESVSIGDLDADGKPDLAVANFGSNTVSVLRNTSMSGIIDANSFATKVDYSTGTQPQSVSTGDLDGDGKPDLAVANYSSNTVSIFRNISIGGTIDATSFAPKVDYTTGSYPQFVSIGDLDGDGKADLAVTNLISATVSIFRNISTSGTIDATSFAPKVDYSTGSTPRVVSIGDLDGDGKPDLAVTNGTSNTISVLRNTSTSGIVDANSFAAKVDYASGSNPQSVAIGDLDGDGKADLVVSNINDGTLSVLKNTIVPPPTWSGSVDTDWNTTTNWVGNVVPITMDEVIIPDVANDPIITSDIELKSIHIEAGAVLTVSSNSLKVNNVTTLDGNMAIASGASFLPMGTIVGSGSAVVNRNTTFGTSDGKYSVIGSPITSGSTSSLGSIVYSYDETVAYDPSGTNGSARFIAVAAPETIDVGDAYFSANTGDIAFSGIPNSGINNVSLIYDESNDGVANAGFNLVSNPYTAAISYTSFMAPNSDIDGTIYIWDDGGSNSAQRTNSDYLTANSMGAAGAGNARAGNWDGYIRSTQGFFVKANTAGTLNFAPTMMYAGNNSDAGYFRKTDPIALRFSISSQTAYNDILIGFDEEATFGIDRGMDAYKIKGNNNLQFYSRSAESIFAIQALPTTQEQLQVDLGFDASESGTYTITIEDISSYGSAVLLIDHIINQSVNLTEVGAYSFSTNAVNNSDRFSLVFAPQDVLALNDQLESKNLTVFAIGHALNVRMDHELKNATVNIYTLSGALIKQVHQVDFLGEDWTTTFVHEGVFILTAQSRDKVYIRKFIKR